MDWNDWMDAACETSVGVVSEDTNIHAFSGVVWLTIDGEPVPLYGNTTVTVEAIEDYPGREADELMLLEVLDARLEPSDDDGDERTEQKY